MNNTHGSPHCIRQCDRAGRLLRESLKLSYAKQNEQIVQVRNFKCECLFLFQLSLQDKKETCYCHSAL